LLHVVTALPKSGAAYVSLEELRGPVDETLLALKTKHFVADVDADMVMSSSAPDAICGYALRRGVDLIVVASHGRSAVERLLVGSVAERVTRHAPCSVLVVRSPS
jgi:nucleotide-binding universal stress UspA family protein